MAEALLQQEYVAPVQEEPGGVGVAHQVGMQSRDPSCLGESLGEGSESIGRHAPAVYAQEEGVGRLALVFKAIVVGVVGKRPLAVGAKGDDALLVPLPEYLDVPLV